MQTFSIKQAVWYGLNTFISNLFFFIKAGLVVAAISTGIPILYSLLLKVIFKLPGNGFILLHDLSKSLKLFLEGTQPSLLLIGAIFVGVVISALLSMWAMVAWVNVGLRLYDTKSASLNDLFSFVSDLPQLITIMLAVALLGVLGTLAFIIPGIYFLIRSCFAIESALDKPQEGLDPIRTSFAVTKGFVFRLILLFITVGILAVGISVCCGGFARACSSLNDPNAIRNCLTVSGLITMITMWMCGTITALIKVYVYRQLVPRS